MSSTNPIKTAPRTESGQTAQTLLDQRATFQDAYSKGLITKAQYDEAMAFNSQQIAAQQSYNLAPTSSPAPVVAVDSRTDEWQESVDFYNSIGKPEYGGIYAKPDIPEGFTVTNVTKNSEGALEFELYGQPTDNGALDQAIQADQVRKAFMLGANTRQGTSPSGMNLQQITAPLSPEDQAAFNDYQKKTVTASMTDLGLAFAVGAAPIVAPAVGVAATTIIAGEVASVGIAQGVKIAEGGGVLTLDETLTNAAIGGALSGTGAIANNALRIGGAGFGNLAARVGVNTAIGAGASAGVEYATTGKVTPENVASGAVLGAGIGVAGEALGAGVGFLKGKIGTKGGFDPYSGGGKTTTTEAVNVADDLAQIGKIEQIASEPFPPKAQTIAEVNAKIDSAGFNKDVVNSKIDLQLRDAGAYDNAVVDSKIANVLKEAELWKAQQPKAPTISKPSEFITDLGTSKGGMSSKGGDYLITQPNLKNLEISKGLNIKNNATFDPAEANAKTDAMIGSIGDYRSTVGQGLTLTKQAIAFAPVDTPTFTFSGKGKATGFMVAPPIFKAPDIKTTKATQAFSLGGGVSQGLPKIATGKSDLIGKINYDTTMNHINRQFGNQNFGVDEQTSNFLAAKTAPINVVDVQAKIDQQLGGAGQGQGSESSQGLSLGLGQGAGIGQGLGIGQGSGLHLGQGAGLGLGQGAGQDLGQGQGSRTSQALDIGQRSTPITIPAISTSIFTDQSTGLSELTKTTVVQTTSFKVSQSTKVGYKTGLNFGMDVTSGSRRNSPFGRGYRQGGRIYPIVTGKQFLAMGLGKVGKGLIKKTHAKSKGRKKK